MVVFANSDGLGGLKAAVVIAGSGSGQQAAARWAQELELDLLAPDSVDLNRYQFVLICDESVSALDVSVQAQILNLLLQLQQEMNLAIIFISHDLSVVKHVSDKVAVMYFGKVVEAGKAKEIYANPQNDYTKKLLSAIPITHPKYRKKKRLAEKKQQVA